MRNGLEFGRLLHAGPDREARYATARQTMEYFNGFLPVLGVTPETIPTVETAYCELLDALDEHLLHFPYLLGGISEHRRLSGLMAPNVRSPLPATRGRQR